MGAHVVRDAVSQTASRGPFCVLHGRAQSFCPSGDTPFWAELSQRPAHACSVEAAVKDSEFLTRVQLGLVVNDDERC